MSNLVKGMMGSMSETFSAGRQEASWGLLCWVRNSKPKEEKSENENQTTLTEKVLGFYALGLLFFILWDPSEPVRPQGEDRIINVPAPLCLGHLMSLQESVTPGTPSAFAGAHS